MKLNVGQMLTNRADLFGKKEGFVRGDVRLTFGELNSIRIFQEKNTGWLVSDSYCCGGGQ